MPSAGPAHPACLFSHSDRCLQSDFDRGKDSIHLMKRAVSLLCALTCAVFGATGTPPLLAATKASAKATTKKPATKSAAKKAAAKPAAKPAAGPPFSISMTGVEDLAAWPEVFQARATPADALPVLSSGSQKLWGIGFNQGGKSYVAALIPDIQTGKTSRYMVKFQPQAEAPQPSALSFGPGKADITVMLGGKYFGRYNSTAVPKPFIWPIFGPGYVNVTRNYPMMDIAGEDHDHPHHRGLWFGHGNVNGIDFWAEGEKAGKIREKKLAREASPHAMKITSQNDWVGPDGKVVLQDERTVLFWDTDSPRFIDFFITLKATQGDVTFGDTKEGTFAIRVPKWMTVKDGTGHIETSEGAKDKDAWGKRAAWVDYYGVTPTMAVNGAALPNGGETEGVAILEYPSNFRFPTYWHARDYGLFAANPFGVKEFTGDKTQNGSYVIKKGQALTLGYRVIVHEGDTTKARIAGLAKQFYAGSGGHAAAGGQ